MKMTRIAGAIAGLMTVLASIGGATAQGYMNRPGIWSGFYLGLHAGGGWSDGDGAGFVGGGHAGYNWQAGNLVFGIEGDFSGTNIEDSASTQVGIVFASAKVETDWLASLRARLGTSFGNVLVYGTAGVAWSHAKLSAFASNGVTSVSLSDSTTATGWVAGLGAEMKIDADWSGRIEGLYYGFDHSFDLGNGFLARGDDLSTFVVRGGVTYHLN